MKVNPTRRMAPACVANLLPRRRSPGGPYNPGSIQQVDQHQMHGLSPEPGPCFIGTQQIRHNRCRQLAIVGQESTVDILPRYVWPVAIFSQPAVDIAIDLAKSIVAGLSPGKNGEQ